MNGQNTQQIIQLVGAMAQLVTIVNEMRQGVVDSSTAWHETQARFDQAVSEWQAMSEKLNNAKGA